MDEIIEASEASIIALVSRAGLAASAEDAQAFATAAQIVMQVVTFALHNQADEPAESEEPKEYMN